MIFNCRPASVSRRLLLRAFGAVLLLFWSALDFRGSLAASEMLADALNGLSDKDLKQEYDLN
jgi:hypothetical protein